MKSVSKKGRPTIYSIKLADEICNKIASTSNGLKKLCTENPHWPNKSTIYSWLKNNKEFSNQYARAKRCQIQVFVDEIVEISDDNANDCLFDAEGKIVFNSLAVQRARLRIDSRKWLACKLVPKVYGADPLTSEDNSSLPLPTLKGVVDPNEAARIYTQIMKGEQ